MATDRTLVKGAYDAAINDINVTKHLAFSKGILQATPAIMDTLDKLAKSKRKSKGDYSAEANQALSEPDTLSQQQYNDVYNELAKQQAEYLKAIEENNKKQQEMMMRSMEGMGAAYQEYGNLRAVLGQYETAGDLSTDWKTSNRGKEIMDHLGEGKALVENENGEWGHNLTNWDVMDEAQNEIDDLTIRINALEADPDSMVDNAVELKELHGQLGILQGVIESKPQIWVSQSDLNGMIEGGLKDRQTAGLIESLGNSVKSTSSNISWDDGIVFDRFTTQQSVDQILFSEAANFDSILNDTMIPGRQPFREDFIKMIQGDIGEGTRVQGLTYNDLGITEDQLEGSDKNGDDVLDEDEAKVLYNALRDDKTKDENGKTKMQNYVSGYFTDHAQKQWNAGENMRPKTDDRKKFEEEQRNKAEEKRLANLKKEEEKKNKEKKKNKDDDDDDDDEKKLRGIFSGSEEE